MSTACRARSDAFSCCFGLWSPVSAWVLSGDLGVRVVHDLARDTAFFFSDDDRV
jgi:hypothetical protein